MFGAGRDGLINPPDPGKVYPLAMAEIAVFDQAVYDLLMDLTVLYDMTKVIRQSVCSESMRVLMPPTHPSDIPLPSPPLSLSLSPSSPIPLALPLDRM